MSRYIDVDKAIEYFKKTHKIQTSKILDKMADNSSYRLGDVVSREQWDSLYDENISLRKSLTLIKKDEIEVIHCRDCKHCTKMPQIGYCHKPLSPCYDRYVSFEFFCANGEKN